MRQQTSPPGRRWRRLPVPVRVLAALSVLTHHDVCFAASLPSGGDETECAGHMTKSRTCGANNSDSNTILAHCCPDLVCEGLFCVEGRSRDGIEVDGSGSELALEQQLLLEQYNPDDTSAATGEESETNYAAIMLELKEAREELERRKKEEERQRKEEERLRQEEEQRQKEEKRLRQEEEESLQKEEEERQKEANAHRPLEKRALIRLYKETNGDGWIRRGAWLDEHIDHCNWEGIGCNEYGLVLNISLAENNMTGTIPNVGELQHMEVIDLHANNLQAVLPIRVDYPSLRHVNLANNKLQGTLSGVSATLEFLDLSSNRISGNFEPWWDITVLCPTEAPSLAPSSIPSSSPSIAPSSVPSPFPSFAPSSVPSPFPSFTPSSVPSPLPSAIPTSAPSNLPTSSNLAVSKTTTDIHNMADVISADISTDIHNTADAANAATDVTDVVTSTDLGLKEAAIMNMKPTNNVAAKKPTTTNIAADSSTDISNMSPFSEPTVAADAIGKPTPPCGPGLRYLNLGDNELNFVDVSQLTSLQHLDLSKNTGINTSLAEVGIDNLMFLESLHLGKSHKLSGDLRIGHMQYLKYLDLNGMGLEGDVSLTGILDIPALSEIDLSGNDLTGSFFFCNITNLMKLELGGNSMTGDLTACNLASLQWCDLTDNNFFGSLNFPGSVSALQHLNLHRNAFTGTLPSFKGLSDILYLHLGENSFSGHTPDLSMPSIRYLNISFNELTGEIPSSISQLRAIETIDLSNQIRSDYFPSTGERVTGGLSGQIPPEIGQLRFLQRLVLSGNLLSSTIPETVKQLTYLRVLNLEVNRLSGQIPSSINILEQLSSVLLAQNSLTGEIPDLSGSRGIVRTVTMVGNPALVSPAPFTLCDLNDLDLRTDPKFCPSDRSALAAFYQSTKGDEWLVNTNWVSSAHHCDWYGVTCSPDREQTLKLELIANGVSGQFPDDFFEIKTLQVLDLNDNDIRGAVPPMIKEFRDLQYLRLSYNRLTSIPDDIQFLKHLSLVHLHANRLEGNAKFINLAEENPEHLDLPEHRFISDCGTPQDVSVPFVCEDCDMCCNSLEECQEPTTNTYGFGAFAAIGVLVFGAFLAIGVAWLIVRFLVLNSILKESQSFAFKAAGEESVYSFFLADQRLGWLIAFGTILVQMLIFSLFLSAASFDNDDGDYVYSWRCPVNTPECNDERAVGVYGWVMWAFLVTAALLDDLVNGVKLIFLSASRGSAPAFATGMTLFCLTVLAVYSSLFYNVAIAMTNTELIVNAVILLFINDIDEQIFGIVSIINSKWLSIITDEAEENSGIILDQHLREQRRQSTIELARRAMFSKARSSSGRSLSQRDRRNVWRGKMGSGDIFSVGSCDGIDNVMSGSPTKDRDDKLLRLVVSLQKRVQMLERNVGLEENAPVMYDIITESIEPSLASASSEGDESMGMPHITL